LAGVGPSAPSGITYSIVGRVRAGLAGGVAPLTAPFGGYGYRISSWVRAGLAGGVAPLTAPAGHGIESDRVCAGLAGVAENSPPRLRVCVPQGPPVATP
jgi:hypothetical protein